jgi:hypothetical protein
MQGYRCKVTGRNMLDLSSRLHGRTKNLCSFGCGFIHLSAFHDYSDRDPLDSLTPDDRRDIAYYLHHYHGVSMTEGTNLRGIEHVLPAVFDKISGNLECYVRDLEGGLGLHA